MSAFEWLAPQRLWLLLLPLLAWTMAAWRQRRRAAAPPAAAWCALAAELELPRSWRVRLAAWPRWLARTALLLLLLAAARPATRVEAELPIAGLDLALCLDRSSSMTAADGGDSRSRLAVAQAALTELVAARPEDRFALVPFARWPDVRSPLTRDHAAIREFLTEVATVEPDSVEDATGIGTALFAAGQLLAVSDAPARVIVLVTDGEENVAAVETPEEIAPLHAAQWCAARGIHIHAIVTGGDALDTRQVAAAAAATGGHFFRARDAAAVAAVARQLDPLERARRREVETRHVEHGGVLVAAAGGALLLAALLVLLGAAVDAAAWRRQRLATALRCGALLLALAALLQPVAGREERPPTHRGDLVFALDVSRSMLAADAAPNRLVAARTELAELARAARGERFALIPFAGVAARQVPLTVDGEAFAQAVLATGPEAVARGGSDLGAALRVASDALRAADSAGGAIVLLTDGEDLAAGAAALLPELRARGIVVHAVGYGSPLGSRVELGAAEGGGFAVDAAGAPIVTRLDEAALATLATATGGRYLAARDHAAPLAALWQELPRVAGDRRARPEPRPLLPGLALGAAALLLGAGLFAATAAARDATPVPRTLALGVALATGGCSEAPAPDLATPAWNAALAARAAGDGAAASVAAERAAAAAPARFEARVAFLRGVAAWDLQSAATGAAAIAACRVALAEWSSAAQLEPEWDELRRNCERAALRLRQLVPVPPESPDGVADERRRVAVAPPAAPPPIFPDLPDSPALPPEPLPPIAPAQDDDNLPATLNPLLEPLPAAALERLAATLAAREQEKRAERAKTRRAADAAVERDW